MQEACKPVQFSGALLLLLVISVVGWQAEVQASAGPVYVAPAPSVPQPVDQPFDGVIELQVDTTDTRRRIFSVRQRIPVGCDRTMTLLYPRWEAASHGPSLTVTDLAGLIVEAAGERIRWRRDPHEPHAFRLQVPPGQPALLARIYVPSGQY